MPSASVLRLEQDGAAKARRRIRFAGALANNSPGETAVPLRLTKRDRRIVRAGEHRRLRGVMEIRTRPIRSGSGDERGLPSPLAAERPGADLDSDPG